MAVLLAFNEREGIDVCEPRAGLFTTNDAAVALAGINRAGFGCHSSAIGHTAFAPLAEGWAHVRLQPRLGTTTYGYTSVYLASLCDPAGAPLLGIWQASGSSTIHARWHGNETDAFPAGGLEVADFAFHWKLDATDGFLRIYRNGALIMDVAGNTLRDGSTGSIDRIRFQATGTSTVASTGASAAPYFAQVLVSTEPTIGARVHTLPLTGFGATNEWAGAIGNINGTDQDETTLLTADAPATVLFAKGSMAPIDTATEHVSAVILSHWSLADLASAQQALVPLARLDGANHAGAPLALSPSFRTRQHAFALNPATAAGWAVAEINGAEFGLRAE